MKGSTKLFRIFGIDIKLHFSWWFVFILLSWSLSSAFFPHFYPGMAARTYWLMGVTASLLLFVSVLLHELSHSLVAKAKKIKVESITLFFFGGVAGIDDEGMKPATELQMALAGPLFSLFLAGIFYLLFRFNGNLILTGIMFYLYQLNLILALFNLVPGFPLDGGRALRAILYAYYHDLKKATRIAARGGKIFAGFLVFFGVFGLITGFANSLWSILLGAFLWFIAGMSYEQVVIKEALAKLKVKDLMEKKFLKVSPDLTFFQLLKDYYRYSQESFVVQKNKKFLGILDLKKIKGMNPESQKKIKVSQLMIPLSKIIPVNSEDSGYASFKSLMKQELDLLPVKEGNLIKGIISRKTLMHYLVMELKYKISERLK